MKVMVKPKNRGTHLEELLAEDGRLQESTNKAIKSVLVWQLQQAMKKRSLTKQKMAAEMNTSRAQLDRILDPKKGNVTIETLQRAAKAVGRELKVELV
jgi:antitoxin HicB